MSYKIHPSIVARGSLGLITFALVVLVFLIQPYFLNCRSVNQAEYVPTLSDEELRKHPKYYKARTSNSRMAIILMTSNSSYERIPDLMNTWGGAFMQTRFSGGLFFTYIESDNKTYKQYWSIPRSQRLTNLANSIEVDSSNYKNLDLAIKEIHALEYFLQNSTSEWLFRGVDDTFVNMNEFPTFFTSLPDPTNKSFIFGDCIDIDTPFLHGGSGVLMSRQMAKQLFEASEEWLKEIIKNEKPEEIYFSSLLKKVGFEVSDGASSAFMGIFTPKNNLEKPNTCSSSQIENQPKYCPNRLSNLKKTVFFHDKNHQMTMSDWENYIDNLPDNLYWVQQNGEESICIME
ncbi:hypothetical protein TRFO_22240 [Tritrichomonas foetus]|uniref:Nucleotide-diphospho-sugar transferase domain-containing protein n=1 Tax=Tritrichomonas foetus TaxID=1144522 RepID=A0A1J4KC54_9EUKA|nr:hypothetical protein TRFO_22240 [Tritrichomonas foetus]|eukprot:OHT09001.1 hypothetical protein TRFO_22240 [Tritrichomonas foetus]